MMQRVATKVALCSVISLFGMGLTPTTSTAHKHSPTARRTVPSTRRTPPKTRPSKQPATKRPTSKQARPLSIEQQVKRKHKAFLAQRKTARYQAAQAFPKTEKQRWHTLLKAVETHAGQLSKATLASLRKTLELESDRDRNRFTRFPETLTARIIKNMVTLGLKMRLFPRGLGGPSHQIQAPAPRTTPKTKTKQPASALPTLVFTQKDLERFQPPKTKLSWPIKGGKIGSGFGWRSDPFTRRRSFHGAVDIGAPFGTPVYAAAGGLVVRTGWMGSCGMGVIIRHSTKMKTYYCHLSQLLASRGTVVSRGSMIGRVGSTGRSTSPHLHFVVSLYGRAVNPRDYLP